MVLTYFMKTATHKFPWFFHGFYHRASTFYLHGIDTLYEDCYSINFHGFYYRAPVWNLHCFPTIQLQKCQVISKLFTVFLHNNFLQTFYIVLLLSVSVPINLHDHCKDVNLKTRVFTVIIDLHDM
jgi:hypothetical protein